MPTRAQFRIDTLSEPVAVPPHRPLPELLLILPGCSHDERVSLARSELSDKPRAVHFLMAGVATGMFGKTSTPTPGPTRAPDLYPHLRRAAKPDERAWHAPPANGLPTTGTDARITPIQRIQMRLDPTTQAGLTLKHLGLRTSGGPQ